jgi:sugar phosphate isomerase/epimerase
LDKDQALAETQRKEPVTPAQGVAEQEESGAADKGADSEEPETSAGSSEEGVLVEEGSIESSEEPDEEPREERRLIFPLSFPVALTELRESIPFLLDHKLNAEVVLADTTYNGEVSIRELERLAIELRRNKIKVIAHLPHHDLKLASHDKMVLQHSLDAIQEGLEIGKILGARVAVFHSGFSNHVRPDETDWWVEQCVAGLEDLVARAREEEVIVALENTWESDETVITRLFEAVESPWLRFCCDVGHAACFSHFAPEEWIVQFREKIVNLNVHDNDGMQDQHLACGEGVVGYDVVCETIGEELDEPVNITLEVRREDVVASIKHLEECGLQFERPSS